MQLGGSIVVGYPGEQEHEMQTSIDFVKRVREDYGFQVLGAYMCQPLPPSDLWEEGVARGDLSENMDFSMLRIDADMEHFDSPWYYANEECVPRRRLVEALDRGGLVRPGRFVAQPDELRVVDVMPRKAD
jgi:radical SAM superfamily enzyme YgiQ (UPF0313 family)